MIQNYSQLRRGLPTADHCPIIHICCTNDWMVHNTTRGLPAGDEDSCRCWTSGWRWILGPGCSCTDGSDHSCSCSGASDCGCSCNHHRRILSVRRFCRSKSTMTNHEFCEHGTRRDETRRHPSRDEVTGSCMVANKAKQAI